jgi:anti-anti-sigma regulatory factor
VRRSAIAFALLALAATAEARVVVLDLVETTDTDIQTADALGELAAQLARTGAELRLAYVRAPALAILERAGITERVRVEPTLDAAVGQVEDTPPSTGSVTPVT